MAHHTPQRITSSPHNITTPHWKSPSALGDYRILDQLKTNHHHIATSSLHNNPSINQSDKPLNPTQTKLHYLQTTMPTADLCCINPPHRSLSPTGPARPSAPIINLDGIFAVAALPNDHPHSLKLPVQDRRPPKHLIRSPSFANRLKGQLRRRATVKSLKAEVWDGDARVLTGEDVDPPTVRVREV